VHLRLGHAREDRLGFRHQESRLGGTCSANAWGFNQQDINYTWTYIYSNTANPVYTLP
jgi:hypothetical protein